MEYIQSGMILSSTRWGVSLSQPAPSADETDKVGVPNSATIMRQSGHSLDPRHESQNNFWPLQKNPLVIHHAGEIRGKAKSVGPTERATLEGILQKHLSAQPYRTPHCCVTPLDLACFGLRKELTWWGLGTHWDKD